MSILENSQISPQSGKPRPNLNRKYSEAPTLPKAASLRSGTPQTRYGRPGVQYNPSADAPAFSEFESRSFRSDAPAGLLCRTHCPDRGRPRTLGALFARNLRFAHLLQHPLEPLFHRHSLGRGRHPCGRSAARRLRHGTAAKQTPFAIAVQGAVVGNLSAARAAFSTYPSVSSTSRSCFANPPECLACSKCPRGLFGCLCLVTGR